MVRNTLIMLLCIMGASVHATTPHSVPCNPEPQRTTDGARDQSMILKVTGAQLVVLATSWDPGRLFGCSPPSPEVRYIADVGRFVGFSLFMAGVVVKRCCRKRGKERHV